MRLIGINGLMGSGKDTTYTFIAEHHEGARRVAFADKLKSMAALAVGFDPETPTQDLVELMNECKERWGFEIYENSETDGMKSQTEVTSFTGRQYLQWLGANARTVFGDTFWIDQVLPQPWESGRPYPTQTEHANIDTMNAKALEKMYPGTDLVVVTDVRYPNEAERVQGLGGEVWEVLRPGLTSDGHSSEIPLPRQLVNRIIHNDGTLEDLSRKVKEAIHAQ